MPDAPLHHLPLPSLSDLLGEPANSAPTARRARVEVDKDGAWEPSSSSGILKPAVIMFGESIQEQVKRAADEAIERSGRLLVLATSPATYSAWRLAKRANDGGMPIAIVNMGGGRGEDHFFANLDPGQTGSQAVRTEILTEQLLPALVKELRAVDVP